MSPSVPTRLPVDRAEVRLRRVLDDRDVSGADRSTDLVDVDDRAVQVGADDGPSATRHRRRDSGGVQQQRVGVNVDVHRVRTDEASGDGRVAAGVGDGDDLVAATDAERAQTQLERIGPVADGDDVSPTPHVSANSCSKASTSGPPRNRPRCSTRSKHDR